MKYQTSYNAIVKALNDYKALVDSQEQIYLSRKADLEKEVARMRAEGKYTREYIAEYERTTKPRLDDIKQTITEGRKSARENVNARLQGIRKELDKYFNAPVSPEFANKVQSIAILGVKLSDTEFNLLKQGANSYLEMRLLNQLAENRTRAINAIDMRSGSPQNTIKEVANRYTGIDLPSLEKTYNALSEFENRAKHCLSSYIGKRAENGLREVAELGKDNQYPPVWSCASADAFFRENANKSFVDAMEKANSLLPEVKSKRALTDSERELIDLLIDPTYPTLAKSRVKEVVKCSEEMTDLLKLDDRYKDIVESLAV